MARGTRDDPFSPAEIAEWLRRSRERWMKVAFAKEPPDGLSDWIKDPWHGWIRKRAGTAKRPRAKQKGVRS